MAPITLWFLQASRSIRNAWLLEELGLSYEVKFSNRENGVAPAEFKKAAGGLGKFPMLQDGDITIGESGLITEYLCDVYDKGNKYLPAVGDPQRYKVLQWVHAAEATWALHGISILYARWNQKGGDVKETEAGMSKNVIKDMDFLEAALRQSSGKWLCGDKLSAADFMMHFSAAFIIARELGVKSGQYPATEKWLKECEATESYKKAVKNTGHSL